MHKTLQSILKMEAPKNGDIEKQAISLFDKIPSSRTCADAFIEPHWCACLSWEEISIENDKVVAAVENLIEFLNHHSSNYRDICEKLEIDNIFWSAKLHPTNDLLKFEKSKDHDGFMDDFSSRFQKIQATDEIYQIKIRTRPGDGLFETSVNYNVKNKIAHVSRINQYGSQARCIENEFYDLRMYCYCKN